MLINNLVSERATDVMTQLSNSKFEFYLTGSRFFGNHLSDSDYDYFANYSVEITKFLQDLGFKTDFTQQYDDSLCQLVLTKTHLCDKIHVQLVSDLDQKLLVQKTLYNNRFMFNTFTKQTRSFVWKVCVDLVLKLNKA